MLVTVRSHDALCNVSSAVHIWNYRRWVAQRAGTPAVDEAAFAWKKIEDNCSNYSAWHHRSVNLPLAYKDDPVGLRKALLAEFKALRAALYMDSADQSGWFYHRWLVDTST